MKLRTLFTLAALVLGTLATVTAAEGPFLRYSQPSQKWMGALPLGNGRLGAMVYGGVDRETIALNEVTLWSGQPDPEANNLCGPETLRQIREAFLAGDYQRGNDLGWQNLCGHGKSFGTHLPFGDLLISRIPQPAGTPAARAQGASPLPADYVRQLSLGEAVATVSYREAGVRYRREYFTSNPAQVLTVRYTASRRQRISVEVSLRMLRHVAALRSQLSSAALAPGATAAADLVVDGDARFDKNGEGGVSYRGVVRVAVEGGTLEARDGVVRVTGADAMTITVDIRTDFQNEAYREQAVGTVDAASAQPYAQLKRRHVADYGRLFGRMSIDLGPGTSRATTTDTLFYQAHKGLSDPRFDALFFQYGRYMQISSSRENSPLPSNLQGIWNDNLACNMPWTCDYHLDINIQQNYWSTNVANLAECNEPLVRYLALLTKYGHATARQMYGCDGWVAHTINNVWGDTAPGNSCSWAMNVTAGAWMMTHVWTHFEFTRDTTFLRRDGYISRLGSTE